MSESGGIHPSLGRLLGLLGLNPSKTKKWPIYWSTSSQEVHGHSILIIFIVTHKGSKIPSHVRLDFYKEVKLGGHIDRQVTTVDILTIIHISSLFAE